MKKHTYIAFDIDGTTVHTGYMSANDAPSTAIIGLMKKLSKLPSVRIIIWSGGGAQYAQQQARRFNMEQYAWRITSKLDTTLPIVDIAFDDEPEFAKALVNITVPFAAPKDLPPK
jgi:hypothetical protein